jgi:hypothetical protein
MIGRLFDDLADIVVDTATVALTPVAVTAAVAREIVKPAAEIARDMVDAVADVLPRDGMTGR